MRILSGIILALCAVVAWTKENVEATYPSNPNVVGSAVFVAGSGVTRLELDGLMPTWHSLDGVEPFEPVVAGGLVVVGSPSGLFALDLKTGEVKWHVASPHALFTPTVVGGVAYAGGEDGMLRAVELRSGHERWHHQLSGWIFSPAAVSGHLVTGGSDGMLWCLTAEDGNEQWHKEVGEELIFRPVAGGDDPVYVSTSQGGVLAVGAQTGELRWQTRMATPTTATVYGNRIFFVQFSGLVTAHDRYNGERLWEYQMEGSSTVPARILDGDLLVVTDDGGSALLNPESGEVIDEAGGPQPEVPQEPPPQETSPKGDQWLVNLRTKNPALRHGSYF